MPAAALWSAKAMAISTTDHRGMRLRWQTLAVCVSWHRCQKTSFNARAGRYGRRQNYERP